MSRLWNYLLFHGWMSYLMTTGLLIFTSGFLLNRISRPERAECTLCTEYECNARELLQDPQRAAITCFKPKARVVLLIVDALKYEFAKWHEDENAASESYNRNKLPIIHELLKKEPLHSRLYKFIADPPTTTMQRLQGFTTGSLPTFIDIGSNFATESIGEDNFIDQTAVKGSVVFMGDDTWINLFPGRFKRQFPSPSFNVWDLDSVDKDVQYRIFFEMKKKDWSLLIAHVLGIDHCGHKHGSYHPEMTRKLNETNYLIKEIIESLDKDMILFVVGDHGMTESGDHGGDSPSEVEAAMFVHSKLPLISTDVVKNRDIVNQIDLVPTLASILGLPVPFSNLGFVILDSLPSEIDNEVEIESQLSFMLHSIWRNIVQTKTYIDTYSKDSQLFSSSQLEELEDAYKLLSNEMKKISNMEEFDSFVENSRHYFSLLKDTCSEVWIQFDSKLMSKGLILMFCTLFFHYLFITGIPTDRMSAIFETSYLRYVILTNLITALVIVWLFYLNIIGELRNTIFFTTGTMSIISLIMLIAQNWDVISINWYNYCKIQKWHIMARIIFASMVCGLFSNSYIVEEDKVLAFLLITLIFTFVFNLKEDSNGTVDKRTKGFTKLTKSSIKLIITIVVLMACVSVRLTHHFWQCREEHQGRNCSMLISNKAGILMSSDTERVLLAVTLFVLAFYITIVRLWLRNCGNLTGFSPSVMVGQYCPVISGVCIGCYWVLQRLPKFSKAKFSLSWQVNALPNIVYLLCLCSILILYYRPLSIFLLSKRKDTINVYQRENIVPQLFERIKESMCQKQTIVDKTPVIYGLGTVYSATFISFSIFFMLLFSLLVGDMLSPSVFLMFVTCICVLGLSAVERYRNATSSSDLVNVSSSTLLCWFLIAEYFFYGTGHQAAFPKIHWDAAFVGTGGHYYGNILPVILIGINTFGSYIVLGAALPLLVIVPFTLCLVFSKLCKAKHLEDINKRGEFALFDQGSTFHGAIFTVSGKYIMLHGIRTFATMLAATIHCRHLMVWKIFAPKLIFEGLGFIVTLLSVLASFYMVYRIDKQIEQLITRITKNR